MKKYGIEFQSLPRRRKGLALDLSFLDGLLSTAPPLLHPYFLYGIIVGIIFITIIVRLFAPKKHTPKAKPQKYDIKEDPFFKAISSSPEFIQALKIVDNKDRLRKFLEFERLKTQPDAWDQPLMDLEESMKK